MANKTIQSSQLKVVAAFGDFDDRTLTVDNPKSGVTKAQIQALESAAGKVLLGDKAGDSFTHFKSAKIRTVATTYFDLTPQA